LHTLALHPWMVFSEGKDIWRAQGCNSVSSKDVLLHVYHLDPCTGYLNNAFFKSSDLGMYHCGIQVKADEWSFGFYKDSWNDPSVSGVHCCRPKHMIGYEYQETVNLGPTPLSNRQVQQVLASVQDAWPACSYHIVHRNCVTFAEDIAGLLQVPEPFPTWTKGALDFTARNARMDAVGGWTCGMDNRETLGSADCPKMCGPPWSGQRKYAPHPSASSHRSPQKFV